MSIDCSIGIYRGCNYSSWAFYQLTHNWGWAAWQFYLFWIHLSGDHPSPSRHRKQLRSLDLTGNRICGLEPLGVLPDLRKLAASDNALLGDDGMVDGWWIDIVLFFSILLSCQGGEICWNCQLFRAHDGAGHWGFLSLISSYLCQVYGLPTLIELELRRGHNVS